MSSLPLISHHLFVAAVASDAVAGHQAAHGSAPCSAPVDAGDVALEVLDMVEALPARAAQLRPWGGCSEG